MADNEILSKDSGDLAEALYEPAEAVEVAQNRLDEMYALFEHLDGISYRNATRHKRRMRQLGQPVLTHGFEAP